MLQRSLERILVNNQVRVFAHPNLDPMCKGNQEKLRSLCNALQWLCVVIVDAVEPHLIEVLEFLDTCRERGNGSSINWRLFLCPACAG